MGGSIENTETRGMNGCDWMEDVWRGARNTTEEVDEIEGGGGQKVGFGEHKDNPYVKVLKMNPQYAEYLVTEGRRDHLAVGKFNKWINRRGISIEKDVAQPRNPEWWGFRREGRSL